MGWFYKIVELKSGLNTVEITNVRPNIYAIINNTNADLLIGLKNIPTNDFYEFKIGPNTTDLAGIPEKTDRIYIINKGTEKINVLMFYMYNEYFDPLIFKSGGNVTATLRITDGETPSCLSVLLTSPEAAPALVKSSPGTS